MSKDVMVKDTDLILLQLKRNGQMLDSEIAMATGISMQEIESSLEEMTARGQIMRCRVTRYENGELIQAMQCRISGYVPPASPGRKPG